MKENIQYKSGNILIRPLRLDDIKPLYEAVRESILEASKWMPWCHPDYSIEETKSWVKSQLDAWKNHREFSFCIIDSDDNNFLGGCGLNQFNRAHNFANLGYWVRSSQTGKGFATTATKLVAKFGFEILHLSRIEILTAVNNIASLHVAEKAGAKREGALRNRLRFRDRDSDAILFSLIPNNKNEPLCFISRWFSNFG